MVKAIKTKRINRKAGNNRPSWDDYFLQMAKLVSQRATCVRRKVGAVLARDKKILATGYNGAPSGLPHCLDIGCLREKLRIPSGQRHELCHGLHAEQNAIIQASLHGISIKGSILYVTNHPCIICAKMLINAGVIEIVIAQGYPDKMAMDFFTQSKIKVRKARI